VTEIIFPSFAIEIEKAHREISGGRECENENSNSHLLLYYVNKIPLLLPLTTAAAAAAALANFVTFSFHFKDMHAANQ
jgi:hypothetical protein